MTPALLALVLAGGWLVFAGVALWVGGRVGARRQSAWDGHVDGALTVTRHPSARGPEDDPGWGR